MPGNVAGWWRMCWQGGQLSPYASLPRDALPTSPGPTGDGHFSPIGGYSAQEDMVLILDTARFKYPPHWVPLRMLYE